MEDRSMVRGRVIDAAIALWRALWDMFPTFASAFHWWMRDKLAPYQMDKEWHTRVNSTLMTMGRKDGGS